MILFIVSSFDKNSFFCLYDNETVSRCLKSLPTSLDVVVVPRDFIVGSALGASNLGHPKYFASPNVCSFPAQRLSAPRHSTAPNPSPPSKV
jgi:hypothetical protein